MFDRFRKWLRGEFVCKRCGRVGVKHTFGYGECICSKCWRREDTEHIFFDNSYWLNRLLSGFRSR